MDNNNSKTPEEKLVEKSVKTLRAYQRVFDSEDGQLVFDDMMESCFFKKTTMESDPQMTAFNEGQRFVMMRIIDTLKKDIGTYKKQVEEALTKKEKDPWGF